MKFIALGLTLVLAVLSNNPEAEAAKKSTLAEGELPHSEQTPFYFPPGVHQTSDPVGQMQEYLRQLNVTNGKFQAGNTGMKQLIPGSDSIRVQTDLVSTSTGKTEKMTIVFDNWVRFSDGRIRVSFLNDERFITEAQFQFALKDIVAVTNRSADKLWAYYEDHYPGVVRAAAEGQGIVLFDENKKETKEFAEFKINLDKPIAENPNVTYRELLYLPPEIKRSHFVPRELHLGVAPDIDGILGVAWLNTGLIYYIPDGRIADWIIGEPVTLMHEIIHNSSVFQSLPLAGGFDAEFGASIPPMLFPENTLSLFRHGYLRDAREMSWAFFGLNFKAARHEIYKYSFGGNWVINEAKFREHLAKVKEIQVELLRTYPKALKEFYSKPIYWTAMYDKLQDNNAIFKVIMWQEYYQTILGGKDKTMSFLLAHRPKTAEWAKDSFAKSGLMDGESDESGDSSRALVSFVSTFFGGRFTEDERARIQSYAEAHPEEIRQLAKTKDLREVAKFLLKFQPATKGIQR